MIERTAAMIVSVCVMLHRPTKAQVKASAPHPHALHPAPVTSQSTECSSLGSINSVHAKPPPSREGCCYTRPLPPWLTRTAMTLSGQETNSRSRILLSR
ncbi:hypothetical protein E2C01_065323 [Portunus trituberculatus]|uniref:Uncharacterized protein n=1 Tax=Portunus trituberculatus TaxID=210409 RepID=A0A5B7HM98_PORTR|nr:hypothetical protein [Portunus trituberculatus]